MNRTGAPNQSQAHASNHPNIDAHQKHLATLQAAAALRSIEVSRTTNDTSREAFLVNRWTLSKELPNLEALELFLAVQGVKA